MKQYKEYPVKCLSHFAKQIVWQRLCDGDTKTDIAYDFNVSRRTIGRVEREMLARKQPTRCKITQRIKNTIKFFKEKSCQK